MCSPQLAIAGISQAFKFVQARNEARAVREQALRQREIAEKNYRLKVAQEQLKIRQKSEQAQDKLAESLIEARQLKAKAKVTAETIGGGVLDRVFEDYLRQQGKYKSSVEANLEKEFAQSQQNIKGYGVELESQTPYIPPVNTIGLLGTSAISFAGSYVNWKADQLEKEELNDRILKIRTNGANYWRYGSVNRN
tara:strand:- start:5339 stop:5920 length:582 start_codon:yes stop_codon:yes gene_type:complete